MGCINVREGDGTVSIIKLTECGFPDGDADGRLVLSQVQEVSWEEQVDEGNEVLERNFVGRKCYTDSGSAEIKNIKLSLSMCGIVPALDVLLMNSTAKTLDTDVVGFGRNDLDAAAAVAIEVLVRLDASACTTGGGAAPVAGWLFPLAKNWRPTGAQTLNGKDLVKPKYEGKVYKGALGTVLPTELEHWQGIWDADEWFTQTVFDGDLVLPTASCEPVALSDTAVS